MLTLISFFPLFLVLLVVIYVAAEVTSPPGFFFGSGTYAYQVEGERPLKMEELQAFGSPLLMPIFIWDWRTKKQIACSEESHMDDVTQVRFVLVHQNKLVSASVDGLICIFDTRGSVNHNDHLESVINVGTSVRKVGFFGESSLKLWHLTRIEILRSQHMSIMFKEECLPELSESKAL